ncbi:MAG: NAD(P)H-hydrate epimerase [Planctomycetes bacterium]|nr:NAD(P)H-hydrate epimerase [Planctomycetota bacterium]
MPPRSMTRDEVREVDRRAIQDYGLPGVVLMENAGRGTAELLLDLALPKKGDSPRADPEGDSPLFWAQPLEGARGPFVICAGKGNNGGDGFVIARHLENRGEEVRVLLFADPESLSGDAAVNFGVLEAAGTPLHVFANCPESEEILRELSGAEWVVDALLGTGVTGEIREPYATAITAINAAGKRVLAVDLPSGLDCDTGRPLGPCVRADHTATFVAPKRGFEAPTAAEWTGQVHVIDIGVPRAVLYR